MGHWEEMSVGPKMGPVDMSSGEASHFSDGETEDWPILLLGRIAKENLDSV